jgi:hypothetical protein
LALLELDPASVAERAKDCQLTGAGGGWATVSPEQAPARSTIAARG